MRDNRVHSRRPGRTMPQHLPSTLAALPYAPPADDGVDIVYRDASLLLVNKPAGLLAVPGRGDGKDAPGARPRDAATARR
jgi:23S rRNA-/tRNA-specific pseudouridylate synthase